MEIEIFEYDYLYDLFRGEKNFKEKIEKEVERVIQEKDIFSVQKWLKRQPYADNLEAKFPVMDFSYTCRIYINVTKDCTAIRLITWTKDGVGHVDTIGEVRWYG